MSILLEVDGERYTQFVSADVTLRLDALSNTFAFEATSKDGKPLPFLGGESCVVYVDGDKVLTGSIEVVEVSYSAGTHSILLSGRDKTGDLLDSTLDAMSDLSDSITLIDLIRRVISQLGLNIAVIDFANPAPFTKTEDIISPEPGQNAFEFLEIYAKKRQVLLTSDQDGDIVITRAEPQHSGANIRHINSSDQNNVISANYSYDTTGRYNLYKMSSELNPVALNSSGVADLDSVVNQSGQAVDSDIRLGRQLVLIGDSSFSNEQATPRAQWEASLRKSRGRIYSCVVHGFSVDQDSLWFINTLVSIVDDFCGINADMLLNSINYSFTMSSGSQSQLQFIEKTAYTLTLDDPKNQELGDGLTE